jgi:acyl carrier protein phosphodiesterase
MNYLAHAYLSFNQPDILAGNMISDFVKGKKKFNYSIGIQQGITLHRSIDEFTDNHPATKSARKFFQPHYGLYSAVFMDVVYDHFLACDQHEFNDTSLMQFSHATYEILNSYEPVFPDKFRSIYPYMKEYNWLYNYRNTSGIRRSFEGISYRALYMSESDTAYKLFNEHYEKLQNYYSSFFPSLKDFAFKTMESLR